MVDQGGLSGWFVWVWVWSIHSLHTTTFDIGKGRTLSRSVFNQSANIIKYLCETLHVSLPFFGVAWRPSLLGCFWPLLLGFGGPKFIGVSSVLRQIDHWESIAALTPPRAGAWARTGETRSTPFARREKHVAVREIRPPVREIEKVKGRHKPPMPARPVEVSVFFGADLAEKGKT